MRDASEKVWLAQASRKLATQKATTLSIVFLVFGFLFYLAPVFWIGISPSIEKLCENIAFGLAFPAIFSFIWERTVAPLVADELIAKIDLKRNIQDIGIEQIALDADEEWDNWISMAENIEVYFDLDSTWWRAHRNSIQRAINRGCKVKVVVLDVSDPARKQMAGSMLDFQLNLTEESSSQTEFYFNCKPSKTSKVEVRRSLSFPLNSAIVIDDNIFLRMNHITSFDSKFLYMRTKTKKKLGAAVRLDLDKLWKDAKSP